MSLIARLPARNKYQCDICGRHGFWDEGTWSRYSSILHDETVPLEDLPVACGDACVKELKRRVKAGTVALPTLRRVGYQMEVTKPGRGYGRFVELLAPESEHLLSSFPVSEPKE